MAESKGKMQNDILLKIGKYRILPVVKIMNLDNLRPMLKALESRDLPVVEITFRSNLAYESIKIISEEYPHFLVGAGTVISMDNLQQAISAGAKFIVTPGFNPKIIDYCLTNKITIIPGVSSPTLIEMALEKGLNILKLFPAEPLGGISFIKAMSGPYPHVKFIPTGGLNQDNVQNYLDCKGVYACAGSWIMNLIKEKI